MTRYHLWPDAPQILLLRAALGDGDAARQAFAAWGAAVDFEHQLDGGSFRLLPMLHANMRRLGVEHRLLGRMAGVHRYAWVSVQQTLKRAEDAAGLLQQAGIASLFAKGVVLAKCYYASPGLRPMSDVDLVVHRAQAFDALAVLERAGWRIADDALAALARARPRDCLAMQCALPLVDRAGKQIDLHWRMVAECARAEGDARFWGYAQPLMLGNITALRPSPTDLLFHILVHGLKPDPLPALRWVADAMLILRADGDAIDWDAIGQLADMARVRARLGTALDFLEQEMGVDLPPKAQSLIARDPCWVERMEQRGFAARLRAPPEHGQLPVERATSLARFAVGSWSGAIPGMAARWLWRRARGVMPTGQAA